MKVVAQKIDAIVVFKGTQRPIPYRFRYREADSSESVVTVDKILLVEEKRPAGIPTLFYDCQSTIHGVQRRYQLRYSLPACSWELYKI